MMICLLFVGLSLANGRDIRTYHLNKNFHMKTLVPNGSPNIECLVAAGDIPIPPKISICFRSNPFSHVYHERTGWNWRTVLSIGTMDVSGTKLEKGLLFGHWYSGPWLSIKTNASDSLSWTFTYDAISWPFQVTFSLYNKQNKILVSNFKFQLKTVRVNSGRIKISNFVALERLTAYCFV